MAGPRNTARGYGSINDFLLGPRGSVSTQVRRRFMVADDLQVGTRRKHALSNSSNRETFDDDQHICAQRRQVVYWQTRCCIAGRSSCVEQACRRSDTGLQRAKGDKSASTRWHEILCTCN